MDERRSATADQDISHPAARLVVIGRGTHAAILLDPESMVVCKQFQNMERDDAAELAQLEFDYLRRFSTALADEPYIDCPRPVDIDLDEGRIWMTHCAGIPLNSALASESSGIDVHLDHIVEQIVVAVEHFIQEFDEPYYDLAPKNMLYDDETRTLSMVDFSSRRRLRHPGEAESSLDISLACLIGLSLYETVRPSTYRNRIYLRRLTRVLTGVLARFAANYTLRPSLIRETSAAIYDHSGKRGSFKRRLWYSSIGQLLFNRRSAQVLAATQAKAAMSGDVDGGE